MPLLRKIRKTRWVADDAGTATADALNDLQTTQNTLSVFEVEDDRSDVPAVIVAIAATRNSLSNLDFAILDAAAVERAGIMIEATPGDTKLRSVNERHRSLSKLRAPDVCEIAAIIKASQDSIGFYSENQVAELLWDAIQQNTISAAELEDGLVDGLRRRGHQV